MLAAGVKTSNNDMRRCQLTRMRLMVFNCEKSTAGFSLNISVALFYGTALQSCYYGMGVRPKNGWVSVGTVKRINASFCAKVPIHQRSIGTFVKERKSLQLFMYIFIYF